MEDPSVVLRSPGPPPLPPSRKKSRKDADSSSGKRRCVSTACIACRRRKSKCDGALPSCAACASVYGTECVYDPNSDHRRKGVYREKIDSMKARTSTLQILIEAILNAEEDDVGDIVKRIRTCDSLDAVAEQILKNDQVASDDLPLAEDATFPDTHDSNADVPFEGERELARKMGELRLENGAVRFIGGTSHLIYLGDPATEAKANETDLAQFAPDEDPILSWTTVTKDKSLVAHLMNMYFNWHYTYFTTLSKTMFYRDFVRGRHQLPVKGTSYCSSLLVNAMLALGCHFSSVPGAYASPDDNRTKGDHFFAEAKRLIMENDEYEKPRLTTVQALALMSVREAGCGREAKGWVYSGMSFRMAQDIGLNFDDGGVSTDRDNLGEHAVDARRITFWGCFLFDKCWSNYLGRLPQIPKNSYNVPKYDVFPAEDAELWAAYTDNGFDRSLQQPSRTRAIGLQLSKLCEISSDLLLFFYHPNHIGRSSGKSVELKKLSELHRRLENWRKELPKELEPKDGQLPNMILVHMFFHLQYIHLFRPFLKYVPSASPLPSHVSPRRICTANAGAISKLMRLYKKTWNLRQICNIAVYMIHSACTIHLLNLPEKMAKRDITHGIRHLEEIAEDWLCARRTLSIISVLARKWNVELPEEASAILRRTDEKYGTFSTSDVPSPKSHLTGSSPATTSSSDRGLSPASRGRGSHSPMSHHHHPAPTPHPSHLNPSTTPDMLINSPPNLAPPPVGGTPGPSIPSPGQQQQPQLQPQHLSPLASMGNFVSETMPWEHPDLTQPIPGFSPQPPQTFTSLAPTPVSSLGTGPPSTSGTRQVSPNHIFQPQGMDQDWFLNDGARWHQHFEGWGLGGLGTDSSSGMYLFQAGATPQPQPQHPQSQPSMHGPSHGHGQGDPGRNRGPSTGSGRSPGPGMGRPEDDGMGGGFEELRSLGGNPAWLPPGLD